MFIPTTPEEVKKRGWKSLDIILVSGDTYIDSSYNGSAVIGHWLIENGFKVGIICQPDIESDKDITRLGEPELFWSISSGCVDSMVANYTPTNKFRKDDDFTPGGKNEKRPDRACIAYTNLIKKHLKGKPIVLGGVEASLRRIVHYDAWSDSLRRSILVDSKADIITYGMSEVANLELAKRMKNGEDWKNIRGTCVMGSEKPEGYLEIPGYEACVEDKDAFIKMFKTFYDNNDPLTARGFVQKHGNRYLIHHPPSQLPTTEMLDRIYEMDFENAVHPYYAKQGFVKAVDTIRNSITTHRGCYGECNFCAISVMQGRTVISRSEDSIIREVKKMASKPNFDGVIRDVGGPTANMYGFECTKKQMKGACNDKRCMFPKLCRWLPLDHTRQVELLKRISEIKGVKRVFIASGIRYDLITEDRICGETYLKSLIQNGHVSGQMKVAPEHISDDVLKLMGKPGRQNLIDFKSLFDKVKKETGKEIYLTYYLIAAHPGCYDHHMKELLDFCISDLKTIPEQVQIFTPTPSTASTMMYYTRRNWENTDNIKSEHSMQMKQRQKDIILGQKNEKKAESEKKKDENRSYRDKKSEDKRQYEKKDGKSNERHYDKKVGPRRSNNSDKKYGDKPKTNGKNYNHHKEGNGSRPPRRY